MYDDGTHGDITAGDGIWTLRLEVPRGIEIQYKFTNSGLEGLWDPGEEFHGLHRSLKIEVGEGGTILLDRFGKI
jgi:hypothetical protein